MRPWIELWLECGISGSGLHISEELCREVKIDTAHVPQELKTMGRITGKNSGVQATEELSAIAAPRE